MGTWGPSLSSGTEGARWAWRGAGLGNLQLPCSGTCGLGASARWRIHRRQWTRCRGGPVLDGAGIGRRGQGRAGHLTQPRKRHEQTGQGRAGTGLCADTVTSLLLPTRPPSPCPTERSPPGPRSPPWGCQGLCSGEYRHFTLNIKRRIAFVTYRSQRGVSVDSKRGKGAGGEAGGLAGRARGRRNTAEPLSAQPGRGHAPASPQQPSRPENIKPEKRKKKGRRGRPMPGRRWGDALATGREREDGVGYGGRDGNREPKKKNKLRV